MDRCKVALIGVGGFGASHVAAVDALAEEGLTEIVAFAETSDEPPAVAGLLERGARRYTDYREMLGNERQIHIVCIATPIPTHFPMAMACFERGAHVFLEKPPAVRIQDLQALIEKQEEKDLFCTVGYGDVARPNAVTLKRRLCEGALGKIRYIHGECRWLRPHAYYERAEWAGTTLIDGEYALDGPMNNAAAHVINLAAYLAGDEPHAFARPLWVQGELYRANPRIDAEDTDCLRAELDTGVEICVHLTLCATANHPRTWTVIGEKGTARLHEQDGLELLDERINLTEREHSTTTLLRRLVEVIQGSDEPLLMPLADTQSHMLISNGAYESSGRIHPIPAEYTREFVQDNQTSTVLEGIDDLMLEACRAGQLLSERGIPWAVKTERFDLSDYSEFPQRWEPVGSGV